MKLTVECGVNGLVEELMTSRSGSREQTLCGEEVARFKRGVKATRRGPKMSLISVCALAAWYGMETLCGVLLHIDQDITINLRSCLLALR